MIAVLLVAAGAAVGAPLRYLTDQAIRARRDTLFPWGTAIVNVAGSLLLGFLIGLPASDPVLLLAGTGFCGALTTYSTFSYETLRLVQTRAWRVAAVSVLVNLGAGIGAAFAGAALAGAIVR
jgi:CrcB protein